MVLCLIKHICFFVIYSVVISKHALRTHTHILNNKTFSTISSPTLIQVTITRARDVCLGVNVFMIIYWMLLEVCEINRDTYLHILS